MVLDWIKGTTIKWQSVVPDQVFSITLVKILLFVIDFDYATDDRVFFEFCFHRGMTKDDVVELSSED